MGLKDSDYLTRKKNFKGPSKKKRRKKKKKKKGKEFTSC